MHMTCRKCKHEFCWICFADWRTHKQCDAQKPEVKSREASEQSAKTELERFEYYMHRWESHKKAADIARRDNTNLSDLEAYFSATFGVRTADVNFLNPTLSTLMSGRLMLSWSYVREFYTENKRISQVEKVRREFVFSLC
jgi:ariadne-1